MKHYELVQKMVTESLEVESDRTTMVINDGGTILLSENPDIEYLILYSAPDGATNFSIMNIVGRKNLLVLREAVDRMLTGIDGKKV